MSAAHREFFRRHGGKQPLGVQLTLDSRMSPGSPILLSWIQRTGEPGAGRRALQNLAASADELGLSIELEVTERSKALLPYYEGLGFERYRSTFPLHFLRRKPGITPANSERTIP